MRSCENHVLPDSDYYVYTASSLAKRLFFYPVCTGYFKYEPGYLLTRNRYDSFLIMLITKGSCTVTLDGVSTVAGKGSVVLLDCYTPHQYGTEKGCEAAWLHFDGPLSREYYEQITQAAGHVILPDDPEGLGQILSKIYYVFKNGGQIREEKLSESIARLLASLLFSGSASDHLNRRQRSLSDAVSYLNEHFAEPVSLKELADRAALSPFYFTRMFAKETGMTPHQYLLATRINSAKFLLKTTGLSIKEVGLNSGFPDESNFCTTFKKWEQMTPSEYRAGL